MDKYNRRNFRRWILIKQSLHERGRVCDIKEGEIWWSSVGENVGSEICGKGKTCVRPVVVFKKLNKYSFWAIPLTSKKHVGNWYIGFEFAGRPQTAVLSQIENMSVFRLHRRMGELSRSDFRKIYDGFDDLLHTIKIHPSLKN